MLFRSTKVAFFGENGSYTEQATIDFFGMDCNRQSYLSFKSVMEAVQNGQVEYGVLPIENSSTGGVLDLYDVFPEYNNYIVGEQVVKIEHVLVGVKGTSLDTIQQVYSHPQGIMQCREFIERHTNLRRYHMIVRQQVPKKLQRMEL